MPASHNREQVPLSWAFGMRSVLLLTGVDAGGPVLPGRRWTWEGARLRPWAGMLAKLRAATANKQRKVMSKASSGQEQSLRQRRSKQATTGSH